MEGRGGGGGAIRRGRHEYRTNKPYERVRPHTHSLSIPIDASLTLSALRAAGGSSCYATHQTYATGS